MSRFIVHIHFLFAVSALDPSDGKMTSGYILKMLHESIVYRGASLESGTISALSPWLCGGRRMVNSLMLLAVEANRVIALRLMKLMRGGKSARREAELMVSERYMRLSKLPQWLVLRAKK